MNFGPAVGARKRRTSLWGFRRDEAVRLRAEGQSWRAVTRELGVPCLRLWTNARSRGSVSGTNGLRTVSGLIPGSMRSGSGSRGFGIGSGTGGDGNGRSGSGGGSLGSGFGGMMGSLPGTGFLRGEIEQRRRVFRRIVPEGYPHRKRHPLVHNAHRIEMRRDSMHKNPGKPSG